MTTLGAAMVLVLWVVFIVGLSVVLGEFKRAGLLHGALVPCLCAAGSIWSMR